MKQVVQVVSHDVGERYWTETHLCFFFEGVVDIIFAFVPTNSRSSKFQQVSKFQP